jgi:DNA-binding NtrC family response regulator
MHAILVATADASFREELARRLSARGHAAYWCDGWAEVLAATAQPGTRLVLVDGHLPDASGELLGAVAGSVPHRPPVYVVRGTLPPLPPVVHIERLLDDAALPVLDGWERALLPLAGLGPEALTILQGGVVDGRPIRIQGERGTGKEWLLRVMHRLGGRGDRFVKLKPGVEPVLRGGHLGTLYLENVDRHGRRNIEAAMAQCAATGWKLVAGSRNAHDPEMEGDAWQHLYVRPLRQRNEEIRPLTELYLHRYTNRLKLPRRRIAKSMWPLIEAHTWPRNQRQLEAFIVQMATSAHGPYISPRSLPSTVLELLDVDARRTSVLEEVEEMLVERLRPLVAHYQPVDDGDTLHRQVVDVAERALLRLALTRTRGNKKATAALVGLARNTLADRLDRLDPFGEDTR